MLGKIVGNVAPGAGAVSADLLKSLGGRIGEKITAQVAGKEFTAILPIIGAATSAGLNAWTLRGIARSAVTYYGAKEIPESK
jgi:hypothetical protein